MSQYRSPLLYDARKIAAAREIRTASGAQRVPGTSPMNVGVAGLGCDCQIRYTGGGLKGYRAAVLNGVHRTKLNGLAQSAPSGTPALVPVSDRKAVDAAIRLFKGLKP